MSHTTNPERMGAMSNKRRPLIADHRVAVVLGLASFAAGWALLYDAYDGRGRDQPRLLRPFTWW